MIRDPKLATHYAMAESDPLVLESVFATLIERTPERESRETARLLRTDAREGARTAAIPRLTRAKRYLDDAQTPLAALAATANHAALTDTLPVLTIIATLFGAAATALASNSLTAVLVDTSLPATPTNAQLNATLEGMAGAYAIATSDADDTFAPAAPIYRDIGILANALPIVPDVSPPASDVQEQQGEWTRMALALVALTATGAYDGSVNRYAHDSRMFVAATLAFRASQLEVRRKLGVLT